MRTFIGILCAFALSVAESKPVRIIFDTDMLNDWDDVGALACLHALADAGECEILATVSCTRGNASVAAIEVINGYYGRSCLPVGCAKGIGVMGATVGVNVKIDPNAPVEKKDDHYICHYKYRKLAHDYPQWVRHLDSDDAPDANGVYRKILAESPDQSVVICSTGFLTNMRRLLETGPDDFSPLDGKSLVARKVVRWVAMACKYPYGEECNSRWDWESSKIALENWPTEVVFSDFDYGFDVYAGRAIMEQPGPRNPVKDIFVGSTPTREQILADPVRHFRNCFGVGGRSAWDETAVLVAVRGAERYCNVTRGTFRMVGDKGDDEWVPDSENGRHLRITEKTSKREVAAVIEELMCRPPRASKGGR